MTRVFVVLVVGSFLTVAVEATAMDQPLLAIALAAAFTAVSVGAYGRIERRAPSRRRGFAVAYIGVQLALGYLLFFSPAAGVGATLLLMVLVSQSVLLLPFPAAALVVAAVPLVHIGMAWGDGLRSGWGTLAAATFTAVVTELFRREQHARVELADANGRLRGYAAQAEELATTQERNRIARDIHDGLGHHLTVVQMQVQAARAVLSSDPAKADVVLARAQQQATEALAEVRWSVAALREPRTVRPLGDALEALAADTSAAGVPTALQVTGVVRALSPEVQESLFRAAQEGLTNVRKHAAARRARLLLAYGDEGTVWLEVGDDGLGTAGVVGGAGFGLLGVRERATRLGGSVDMVSEPGQGTTVRVAVPG